jgi:hypothetical protein
MWHAQSRFDLRPDRESIFNLNCGHNYFFFHFPASYSTWVITKRIYTLRRL